MEWVSGCRALSQASDVDRSLPLNDRGVKPLGEPGRLKTVTGFANQPEFLPPHLIFCVHISK